MNIASLFKKSKSEDNNKSDESVNQTSMPADVVNNSAVAADPTEVPANWIPISEDGEFICSECNNKVAPETNTEEGTVVADLDKITKDLDQFASKVVYGICPVCGMEFTFKRKDGKLYLEPSDMMK